ncbi:MAG: hypothetical protein ACI4E5_12530 [Suilimivivens sp.]
MKWKEEIIRLEEKDIMNIPDGIDDDISSSSTDMFANIPDGIDEELPFN